MVKMLNRQKKMYIYCFCKFKHFNEIKIGFISFFPLLVNLEVHFIYVCTKIKSLKCRQHTKHQYQ